MDYNFNELIPLMTIFSDGESWAVIAITDSSINKFEIYNDKISYFIEALFINKTEPLQAIIDKFTK